MWTKYYVFEEWSDYDAGGMNTTCCDDAKELSDHLNGLIQGKTQDEANDIIENLHIIKGERVTPKIKSVVTSVEVTI